MAGVPDNLKKSGDWIRDDAIGTDHIVDGAVTSAKLATLTANLNLGSNKITNVGNGTADSDAVNLGQLNSAITASAAGIAIKEPARLATTANVATTYNNTGGASARGQHTGAPNAIDGQALSNGDRLLVKNQTNQDQNGIFVVSVAGTGSNGVWDRAEDFDEDEEVVGSVLLFVQEGSVNADTQWVLQNDGDVTIGGGSGTNLVFTQFGAGQSYTADGTTLSLVGSQFSIANGGVDTNQLADDAVTAAKLADNAVDSQHYVDGSIDQVHLASNSVSATKIADGAVTNGKIGADAVDGTKIADDSIDSEHIADGAVDAAHLSSGAVTSDKIGGDAVNGDKIADDSINSEHIVDGAVDAVHLATDSVTTLKIADDAVTGDKIANDSIDSQHYVDGSIDGQHIANNAITAAKINDSSVTTNKIADLDVTTGKIANLAITTGKLAADAVDSTKLADDAVNSEHVADGAIDPVHLAAEAVSVPAMAFHQQEFVGDGATDEFTLSVSCYQEGALVGVSGSLLFPGLDFTVTGVSGGGTTLTLSGDHYPEAAERFVFRGYKIV